MLATAFIFAVAGAMLGAVFDRASEVPVLSVVIGCALTLGFGVPITVGAAFAPSLRPIRDLAEGTERVAAGDYSQRLPVVQDDDLGALAASFNRMQAGLAERQRLQAAFGTYVDPALAARLLEQGDDVFTGERREVTVMFVDVRSKTERKPVSFTVSQPPCVTAAPTIPPMSACEELVGKPNISVKRFQQIAPASAAATMCCVTPAGSTMPDPTIFATAVDMKAPATLSRPATMTATKGLITRVETTVAIALALSCHPFEKSNSSANTTTRSNIPVSSGMVGGDR